MSNTNIEVVQPGFERFGPGNIAGFLTLLSEDVEWDYPGPESPRNRLFKGKADVQEFLASSPRRKKS